MKKKIIGILLCGVLVLGITGCGSKKESEKEELNNNKNNQSSYTTTISNSASDYYGKVITNYKIEGLAEDYEWKIFYADDSNVYLITSDYINYNDAPNKNGYSVTHDTKSNYHQSIDYSKELLNQYEGSKDVDKLLQYLNRQYFTYLNDKGTSSTTKDSKILAYLMDISIWSKFVDSDYADFAIGGAPLEMAIASNNDKYGLNYLSQVENDYGYLIGKDEEYFSRHSYNFFNANDKLYVITEKERATGTILSSPVYNDYTYNIDYAGGIGFSSICEDCQGLRPVVRLKSNIKLEEDGNGYKLVK